jgi:hypothetical protein
MKDFTIDYTGNSIEVEAGGFGYMQLDFGRPTTEVDAQKIQALMDIGARMYADQIKQARRRVDDLIDWQAP